MAKSKPWPILVNKSGGWWEPSHVICLCAVCDCPPATMAVLIRYDRDCPEGLKLYLAFYIKSLLTCIK